jgi:hypothetical protein
MDILDWDDDIHFPLEFEHEFSPQMDAPKIIEEHKKIPPRLPAKTPPLADCLPGVGPSLGHSPRGVLTRGERGLSDRLGAFDLAQWIQTRP